MVIADHGPGPIIQDQIPDNPNYEPIPICTYSPWQEYLGPRTCVRDLPGAASGTQNVQGSYGVLLKLRKELNNLRGLSVIPLEGQSFFTQKFFQLRLEGPPAPADFFGWQTYNVEM